MEEFVTRIDHRKLLFYYFIGLFFNASPMHICDRRVLLCIKCFAAFVAVSRMCFIPIANLQSAYVQILIARADVRFQQMRNTCLLSELHLWNHLYSNNQSSVIDVLSCLLLSANLN